MFVSGPRVFTSSPRWAADNQLTIANTETLIMNIRNATTYNGITNRGAIRLNNISFGSSVTNQTAVIKIYTGTAPSGSPSFTAVKGTTSDRGVTITAGNSIASVDKAGGIVATGVSYVFSVSFAGSGTSVDLTPHELYLAPGEVLSVSGTATGNMASNISLNWSEDI